MMPIIMSSFPPKTSCLSFVWFDFWVWFLNLKRKKNSTAQIIERSKKETIGLAGKDERKVLFLSCQYLPYQGGQVICMMAR